MNLDLTQVCFNLLGLFLLIAVGFGMVKLGVVSRDISGQLSRLLLKVTLPCTIFTSLLAVGANHPCAHGVNQEIEGYVQNHRHRQALFAATILAENYQADQEFAALTVFLSSLLCIVTIPLTTSP